MIKFRSTTSFRGEVQILIGKIQRLILDQFLPASLLRVSASTRAENSDGLIGNDRTQMRSTIDEKMVEWDALYDTIP
jgi:hypothetical protein